MLNNTYAVLKTKKLEESSAFYEKYFKFERSFSSDWYISLKKGHQELAILDYKHETLPEKFRGITSGPEILLNFETDEVDEIYSRFKADGRIIHLELRDEPWGQRHFISEDLNGVGIDVIKIIPPSKEYLKQYNM